MLPEALKNARRIDGLWPEKTRGLPAYSPQANSRCHKN